MIKDVHLSAPSFHLLSDLCLSEAKAHLRSFLCVVLNCININAGLCAFTGGELPRGGGAVAKTQSSLLATVGMFSIHHPPLFVRSLPSPPFHERISSDRWPRSVWKVKGRSITGGPLTPSRISALGSWWKE